MAATGVAPVGISIDVTKDLETLSDLKNLLTSQRPALFTIGAELAGFVGQPIRAAVGGSPIRLATQGTPTWTTSGVNFSLTDESSCTISISTTSSNFAMNQSVDSDQATDLTMGPTPGMVYVNVDLDFDIEGGVSGSGSLGPIGIVGKASGSAVSTFSYCQPVDGGTELVAALKQVFSGLFFPFEPDCALQMPIGSIAKVNFDGALGFDLGVSYGLGSYKMSASNFGVAQEGVAVAWDKLQPPDLQVDIGAEASFSYKHSDHFCIIVQKADSNTALLHLLRSAANETHQSAGITVGITPGDASATVDPQKLAGTISRVTRSTNASIQKAVTSGAAALQNSIVGKVNNWLSSAQTNAGLVFSLSQQSGRVVLFSFSVDLNSPALATESWKALVRGNLADAMKIGGFTLLPGSGIYDKLKRSSAIHLNFFNFQLAKTTDYFQNAIAELAQDGSIRFFADVGEESQFTIKHGSAQATVHFLATASKDTQGAGNFRNAEVDFCIELSETNDTDEAIRAAGSVLSLPANPEVQDAHDRMLDFVHNHPDKKLTLITIFKPSGYKKLSCSPYIVDSSGNSHPPVLQLQDSLNYEEFQKWTNRLMPNLPYVSSLSYQMWMRFNVKANDSPSAEPDSTHVPDRKSLGNFTVAAQDLFNTMQFQDWQARMQFLLADTGFMNICDHLHSLSEAVGSVGSDQQWQALLDTLEGWIKSDVNPDWSKPAVAGLLSLCSTGTTQIETTLQQAEDNSCCTCMLTVG